MKILVLGSNGQLGRCLNDQIIKTNHEVLFTTREYINIADFEATKNKILDFSPELIINTAAYTSVDKAEEEEEKSDLINHLAVANIANICAELNNWLIHISTDYVFDGKSNIPYKEDNKPNPQGVYGKTKLRGESAIKSSGCKHIIIRTAWVFSEYGNNFLKNMMRLGIERENLSIVSDQIGCPTYAQDIAKCIIKIIPQLNSQKASGLYHYCGDNPCSWYDFAIAIFEEAKRKNLKIPMKVDAIKSSAYPTIAKRPAYTALHCSKINNDFGLVPSNWFVGISQAINKLQK